jgi:hypothetical protein
MYSIMENSKRSSFYFDIELKVKEKMSYVEKIP